MLNAVFFKKKEKLILTGKKFDEIRIFAPNSLTYPMSRRWKIFLFFLFKQKTKFKGRGEGSVTCKKLPNVRKSCPKMISLAKWKISTTLQKLTKNVGDFGQNNCCHRLWKVAQSAINRPIWSHWRGRVDWLLCFFIRRRRWIWCFLYFVLDQQNISLPLGPIRILNSFKELSGWIK